MVARILILTADELTWPKDNKKPVLFLGEWCRRYNRKSYWHRLNAEVVPYHWNDRKKLYKDYKRLQNLYEKLLIELSEKLNQIHSVNFSLRYWKILIGPWLGLFIEMLFDRWFMLKQTIEKKEISECTIIERNPMSVVPNDMKHFSNLHIEDDWNEAIYGQLLNKYWNDLVTVKKIHKPSNNNENNSQFGISINTDIKNNIERFLIPLFNRLFPKDDGYFFIESYLSLKTNIKLQMRLGQFPKLWNRLTVPTIKPNIHQRKFWLSDQKSASTKFEDVVRQFIPLHIPTAYLEGYKDLRKVTSQCNWPKKPKCIFTSNAYNSSDFFKIWAAEKTESNTKLIIGQHGGHFGMTPFAFHEKHQIDISDKWLSWGWSDSSEPKIIPVGNLKCYDKKVKYNPNGVALMVEMALPRYSDHLATFPISGQWLDYLEDQKDFLKNLPYEIRKKVLLRLFPSDLGWDQISRWKDDMPEVMIDTGKKNIRKLIKNSRIYISTYNATTYLESLSWNIPTIIFWNPNHWELKREVEPYFELLKSVGVFHETPESAAQKMIYVWNDVSSWWHSKKLQTARQKFCKKFSRKNCTLDEDLKKIFKN